MKKSKITVYFVLIFCLLFQVNSFAYSCENIDTAIASVKEKLINVIPEPTTSSVGGEWLIIGLARSDLDINNNYFDTYCKNLYKILNEKNGILHNRKYTEYSRTVLALSAIGKNPYNFEGYNLIEPICNYEKVIWQGINGPVFALIALDSKNYEPFNSALRQKYADYIIDSQNADGGFSLSKGSESDIDITSMAIIALSKYQHNENISKAIEKALYYISSNQTENGAFMSKGIVNAESTAQVLTALSSLDIKIDDKRFVKNNNTVLDGLMSFYTDNKGFLHTNADNEFNIMASEQCFYALVAFERKEKDKTALYDMNVLKP